MTAAGRTSVSWLVDGGGGGGGGVARRGTHTDTEKMGRETKSPAWSFFIQIKGIDF
jgi:hypothetical protein